MSIKFAINTITIKDNAVLNVVKYVNVQSMYYLVIIHILFYILYNKI
jgi:hypothetical protein